MAKNSFNQKMAAQILAEQNEGKENDTSMNNADGEGDENGNDGGESGNNNSIENDSEAEGGDRNDESRFAQAQVTGSGNKQVNHGGVVGMLTGK